MSVAGKWLSESVVMGHQAAITSEAVDKHLMTWENVHEIVVHKTSSLQKSIFNVIA